MIFDKLINLETKSDLAFQILKDAEKSLNKDLRDKMYFTSFSSRFHQSKRLFEIEKSKIRAYAAANNKDGAKIFIDKTAYVAPIFYIDSEHFYLAGYEVQPDIPKKVKQQIQQYSTSKEDTKKIKTYIRKSDAIHAKMEKIKVCIHAQKLDS